MTIRFSDITGGGIPYGDSAGRPATATTGKLYSNGEAQRLEIYTSANSWENIVQEVPTVSSITGTYSEQTDSGTISIYGNNFVNGSVATAIGTNGTQINASSTTFNSLVQLTAVFTGLSNANEPYDIRVTNPSNLFGILPDALYVNASPVWVTSSGTLGTFNEQVSVSVSATATDSDSTITYALASGSSLPSGVTLNSSTGLISGTLPDITANTTYTFTINASDGVNTIPRAFSITSNAVIPVDYLVVAGGGGGGAGYDPAGGGAGGLRSTVTATGGGGTLESALLLVKNSTYTVTVGTGGAGATGGNNTSGPGASGQNSVFHTITSIGGGGGGGYADGISRSPLSGGSGGGGTRSINGAAGTANQGYAGGGQAGAGNNAVNAGGGGGGAGGIGQAGVTNASGGTGGIGVASSITGSSVTRAVGGTGNFGSGNSGNASGAANTGNGGNGGSLSLVGGNGGSGIVVIAYPDTYPAITTIPGTLTYDQPTRAGYRVYRFTAGTGTITF
jgi:hypothetical protein